jgi:hypothetical protein
MVVDLVKEWGGTEESTILVHGVQAPANTIVMYFMPDHVLANKKVHNHGLLSTLRIGCDT